MNLGIDATINLRAYSNNQRRFSIEKFITALKATTTLERLTVSFYIYASTPDNNRRFIEPLCRCIANLRRHNENHPLRRLTLRLAKKDNRDVVNRFLVAAKQYGIHDLAISQCRHLQVQSIVKFCRDNAHLKVLDLSYTRFSDEDSMIYVSQHDGPQDTSFNLALDELSVYGVTLENSSAETKFRNLIAHVTYTCLRLGSVTVGGGDLEEEMRIVSELIKPSLEHLTLCDGFPTDIHTIEAWATVTQIQLDDRFPPMELRPHVVQQKLQTVATRNRELARFRANPRGYPRDELFELMSQFDSSPTGRYMLACGFLGIPSFFKIDQSTDSSTMGPKKRRRRY